VPGDIVIFEGGDIITADLRILEASRLQADEASLTGESMPVSKASEPLPRETRLMDRKNCLFKGTAVTRGSGSGLVIATGPHTELGRISRLVSEAEVQQTPLEKRLERLGQRLVLVMLVIALLVAGIGILAGREILLAIEVSIALAVAAIPEGLPIVATIALARGMWRLARRNALIVRLSAVETLGATGVVLTDKTGTLTESRMTVSFIELPEGTLHVDGTGLEIQGEFRFENSQAGSEPTPVLDELLTAATLCSNASLELGSEGHARVVGDPTETALLVAAAKRNLWCEDVRKAYPELREEPFDAGTKAMATYNETNEGILVSVKGAPEAVLPNCVAIRAAGKKRQLTDEQRAACLQRAQEMASSGLRTLAIATKHVPDIQTEPYKDLVLLGIVGLLDPPRANVKEAINRCRQAGVRVVMVTGDHAATALHVAKRINLIGPEPPVGSILEAGDLLGGQGQPGQLDLENLRVIARASPEQKYRLIDIFQRQGNVVAMTGDGINDAPALKKADIGIAMGIRGTDVAREAAAMVLQDDNFPTIVEAIAQGRAIYENIRKFVVYLFSCNFSEILIVSLATMAGAPLPLLPLQILFLNLVTDVFPALALGVSPGTPAVMTRKPRPASEPILTGELWLVIATYGLLMSAAVLGAMAIAHFVLGFDNTRAVTVSFCTLSLSQLWHVFNMRDRHSHWLHNEISRNAWIWAAILLCLMLILGAVYIRGVNSLLGLTHPGTDGWLLIFFMSLLPLLLGPASRKISSYLTRRRI
jgi:Ca2+-transporting ATPase